MSKNYWHLCRAFVAGNEIKNSWIDKVRPTKWHMGGGLYAATGTKRLSVDIQPYGTILVSYERFHLGFRGTDRDGNVTLIINGDNGASVTTRKQQSELRRAASSVTHSVVPFSALQAARVSLDAFQLVATTPDTQRPVWKRCKHENCHLHTEGSTAWQKVEKDGSTVYEHPDYSSWRPAKNGAHEFETSVHFLGETLFRDRYRNRYYVCGLDRNDDPRKRHFYLAQLPQGVTPTSVDEALASLRPANLPEGALRQGEWFFVPVGIKPGKDGQLIRETPTSPYGDPKPKPGVPIVTNDPDQMREHLERASWDLVTRARRHRATRMYVNGKVYVSGMVRDAEHTALKLGDGKSWYEVVRNLSTGSWGAGGQVD